MVRSEHPGLTSSSFNPNGNFGLGFYSVFMIADFVQIITKEIIPGAYTLVLEFNNGIFGNSIFRKAVKNEERIESGTLIRIRTKEEKFSERLFRHISRRNDITVADPLSFACSSIAPSLAENLTTSCQNGPKQVIVRGDDWKSINSVDLLMRISGISMSEGKDQRIQRLFYISDFVRPIYRKSNHSEEMIARATILKRLPVNNDYSGRGIVSVGGLTQSILNRFPGIWVGRNEVASRSTAAPICTYEEVYQWLLEQYELIASASKLSEEELIEAAILLCSFGVSCKKLPIAKTSSGWRTYEELVAANHGDHVFVRFMIRENERSSKILPV
ncbi:MAG TPA: hypothetical protein VK528_11320 [Flavobacterium sp.]|nr:hypothetical protein [Flavobacterium sp.]